jgi:hypothetical protein
MDQWIYFWSYGSRSMDLDLCRSRVLRDALIRLRYCGDEAYSKYLSCTTHVSVRRTCAIPSPLEGAKKGIVLTWRRASQHFQRYLEHNPGLCGYHELGIQEARAAIQEVARCLGETEQSRCMGNTEIGQSRAAQRNAVTPRLGYGERPPLVRSQAPSQTG